MLTTLLVGAAEAHSGPGGKVRYRVVAHADGSGVVYRDVGGRPHRVAHLFDEFLPRRGCVTFVVWPRRRAHMVRSEAVDYCDGRVVRSRRATDEDAEGEVF